MAHGRCQWSIYHQESEGDLNKNKGKIDLRTKVESQTIVAKGYSTTYNTPFSFKSSAKDLCPTKVSLS